VVAKFEMSNIYQTESFVVGLQSNSAKPFIPVSALTLLVGQREGHLMCKKPASVIHKGCLLRDTLTRCQDFLPHGQFPYGKFTPQTVHPMGDSPHGRFAQH